jgi:DNA invertase Pin-like site-specific DNA recombinase
VRHSNANGAFDLRGVRAARGSGFTPFGERPQGTRLLAGLKPGDVLITPKLDRMFRSDRDARGVLDGLKGFEARR